MYLYVVFGRIISTLFPKHLHVEPVILKEIYLLNIHFNFQ